MTTPRMWDRLGPISGILFVACFVGGIIAVSGVDTDPSNPAEEIARELADNTDTQGVSFNLFGLSLVFFVVFVAHLRDRFDGVVRGGPGHWLVPVFWGGALMYGAAFLMQGFIQVAQFALDDYGPDVQVAKTLAVLGWNGLSLLSPGIALMMAAAAALILKGGGLPRGLGWLAALGFLASPLPWIPVFALWVLVTSIYLLASGRETTPAPAA
jgi:hypothetical protein